MDFCRLWGEKTGHSIEFIAVPWEQSIQMVREGVADIHAGLFYTEERDGFLDFSDAIFNLEYQVFIHSSILDVNSLQDLVGFRVGVPEGFTREYMELQVPGIALAVYKDFPSLYEAAMRNEIRVFISPQFNFSDFLGKQIKKSPNLQSFSPVFPAYSRNYRGAVAEGRRVLLAEINRGMAQITPEERAVVEHGWLLPGDIPLDLESIRISMESNRYPLTFIDVDGEPGGFLVDLWRVWARKTGRKIVFLPRSWKESVDAVASGKADIHSGLLKNEERSKWMLFSEALYGLSSRFYFFNDVPAVQSLSALGVRQVGVVRGTWSFAYLRKQLPVSQLTIFDTRGDMVNALRHRQVELVFAEDLNMETILERQRLRGRVVSSHRAIAVESVFAGVSKKNTELMDEIRMGFDMISRTERLAIEQRWIKDPDRRFYSVSKQVAQFEVSDSEKSWIDTLGQVRLGVASRREPLEYLDENGEYKGLSSGFIRRFFQQLGIIIAPVKKTHWPGILAKVQEKELDVLPMIVPTPERNRHLNFTKPYLEFPLAIFTRRNSGLITGLADLSTKRIMVERNGQLINTLRRDYPEIELVGVSSELEALEAVSYGQADGCVGNLVTGSYLIDHESLGNVKVAAPTDYKTSFSIGVRKDWPLLISPLNRAIDSLTAAEKATIRGDWLKIRYDQKMDSRTIWKVLALAVLVVALFFWRNSELKRRKEQFEASEKQLKMLINAMPIAMIVVDYNGNIIFDNAQAGREMGNSKSIVGRNSRKFYEAPDDRRRILAMIADKGIVDGELVRYRVDSGGAIDCLLSIIPIRFDGRDVLLAVTVNVTDRANTERALEKAMRQARESDQLKSAFLASMSHELRTPLNSIIGFTGIMLQRLAGPLNAEQNKQLSMVQKSAQHLLALINDVLDISKIEAGELVVACEEFEYRESVNKVVETMRPLAVSKGLALSVDISPEVGLIYSDQRRVEQVLLNLLGNAVKFTESGEICVNCRVENNFLVSDVTDTGSGIKKEDMVKVFETFQQIDIGLNRVHEGTGLGLSISKKLVEKLGGVIHFSSEWGVGSTFTFSLPIQRKGFKIQEKASIL